MIEMLFSQLFLCSSRVPLGNFWQVLGISLASGYTNRLKLKEILGSVRGREEQKLVTVLMDHPR